MNQEVDSFFCWFRECYKGILFNDFKGEYNFEILTSLLNTLIAYSEMKLKDTSIKIIEHGIIVSENKYEINIAIKQYNDKFGHYFVI